MDLVAAEQRNGKAWVLARLGAFACFLVACALLGASLMLTDPSGIEGSFLTPRIVPDK